MSFIPQKTKFLTISVSFSILTISIAMARWGTPDEANAEYEFFNRDITVNKEGQTEEIYEYQLKITNQKGVEKYSDFNHFYNNYSQKFELLDAKSILDDIEYVISPDMMEDKSIASDNAGFDEINQFRLAFSKVEPNTKIYLKYKVTTHSSPLKNYFDDSVSFFGPVIWNQATVRITSALPFYSQFNDPHDRITIEEYQDESTQKLTLTTKKPFCEFVIDDCDKFSSIIPNNLITYLKVSTLKNFEEMGAAFAPEYEKTFQHPLPPLMQKIRDLSEHLTSPIDQINSVTSLLQDKIRYLGDWRSVKGAYFPRTLEKIANSQSGDCKDFATSTAAILKQLGYKAQVALVKRDEDNLMTTPPFASLKFVNHVIVKVTKSDNQVLWIDPTNTLSMADGLFSDIANRFAIVLDSQTPSFEMIPDIDASHSCVSIQETIEFKDDDIHNKGIINYKGEQSCDLTETIFLESSRVAQNNQMKVIAGNKRLIESHLDLPALKSRIVRDLSIPYSYKAENNCIYSNMGRGFDLGKGWAHYFLTKIPSNSLKILSLLNPARTMRETLIKNIDVENISYLNCEIQTPWLKSFRSFEETSEGILMREDTWFLKKYISPEEYKSPIYKQFIKDLEKYYFHTVMMFTQK